MSGLPIKYRDSKWQVKLQNRWVRCDCESDAYQLAASADVAYRALEGHDDKEIAEKIDGCVELCLKYGEHEHANYLREVAKFARHQPSKFDGLLLD